MNTNFIGTITEMQCRLYFTEHEYICSVPEIPARYDFILDTGKRLLKIQVKTCRTDGETIEIATCSHHNTRKGNVKVDYRDNGIDYFCTWFENNCYLIPVQECGKNSKKLRLVPTKNGQVKNISFAKDYIATEVLKDE